MKNKTIYQFPKEMTNMHYDNIRFLAWQYKQNGLLASTSGDKTINLYDIRATRNPVSKILDDDVCKSLKFCISNSSYLATGYDRRLKIWDLKKSTTTPVIVREIFDGAVDILEWHMTQNFLLCGSRQNNILKIFFVKDSLELIQEIKIKDVDESDQNNPNSQKILKAFFIQGHGVIAICEKKAFIYYLGSSYTDKILDQVVNFDYAITNFKIMTNNLNNHYFIYTDKENHFSVKQYTFDETVWEKKPVQINYNLLEKDRNFSNHRKLLFMKEIQNIKRKYANNVSVETKGDRNVHIIKLFQDLITIKIKVTYNDNYPKTLPSVDFENKYESFLIDRTLISNISNEISIWQAKSQNEINNNLISGSITNPNFLEKLITNLMKIISSARLYLEENADDNAKRLLKKQGKSVTEESSILPYVRTCSFAWGPKGQILTFHYNKIDFKQLKPNDKSISNFNNLEDWIKFCEAKDGRTKFSKSENKLIEEESDLIITDSLRSIVDWKSMMELDDNLILNAINRVDSLPNIFLHNQMNTENLEQSHKSFNNNLLSGSKLNQVYDNSFLLDIFSHNNNFPTSYSATLFSSGVRKKSLLTIHQLKNLKDSFILENLKIKLLSKDHFFASVNFLLQSMNHSEVTHLLDILDMINYNINSIIDPANSSELLVKHYKLAIVSTIKALERNKNYEYLYICILLITSRLFDNVIRDVLKVPSLTFPAEDEKIIKHAKTMELSQYNQKGLTRTQSFTGKYFRCPDKNLGFKNRFHKKSELSVASERILPKLITNSAIKPSLINLLKRHRSSSFDETARFTTTILDENSEYHLQNEKTQFIINLNHREEKDEELEYEGYSGFPDKSVNDNYSLNNEVINLPIQDKPERDLISVFGDSLLSVRK
jgi:hypothetical protein